MPEELKNLSDQLIKYYQSLNTQPTINQKKLKQAVLYQLDELRKISYSHERAIDTKYFGHDLEMS